MKLASLRQRDGISCGPAVAIMAGTMLDADYRRKLGAVWFAAEQGRVHNAVNKVWPRRLGTTPVGMAAALNRHSSRRRYRWRICRGLLGRRDDLADVAAALRGEYPVPMLIGNVIPRHWVLLVSLTDGVFKCYEPSSGQVRSVKVAEVRESRLTTVGYPRPFAFVLPVSGSSAATRAATA